MDGALQKYQNLKIRESLSLSYRYSKVCKELSVILQLCYSKSPKPLKSLLFDDTLFAFRQLPQMQTQSAVSAALHLIQCSEAALPKQKRGLAVTEFKQSMVAYKRRAKIQQENIDLNQLPQDVLVHLFSFLDLQSLASTSLVCRSWNAAANDKYLWQFHYNIHFGDFSTEREVFEAQDSQNTASDLVYEVSDYDWKNAFRRAYIGLPGRGYKYQRGYCGFCDSIVWLKHFKCPNKHAMQSFGNKILKPVPPSRIVTYILGEYSWTISSDNDSDYSDSESDDEAIAHKFWIWQ